MSDERIFLTGGAGLIGSNVARKLISLGHEVLLYDSFTAFMSPFQVNYAVNMERRFPPELRLELVVEVGPRHVEELARLRDDGIDHDGMGMSRRGDGDAGQARLEPAPAAFAATRPSPCGLDPACHLVILARGRRLRGSATRRV